MDALQRYKSARNGFVVASALLFAFISVQFLQQGDWNYYTGTAFFLSQIAYWSLLVYYSRNDTR
jgi:uncharacterized membrane protein YhhN